MAWLAANVSIVVTFAGNVARSANVPGNVIRLDGKGNGKEKRKVGKLHCSNFVILDKVRVDVYKTLRFLELGSFKHLEGPEAVLISFPIPISSMVNCTTGIPIKLRCA
jgi:hypothetical protein